jgi:hypothetical protein
MVSGGTVEQGPMYDESQEEWVAHEPETRGRWVQFAIFLLVLPFFGQIFHYVKDVRPLWALSKAWPVLSLPLVLYLFRYPRVPVTRQLLITLLYMILVPSFLGIFTFQQDFFTGLTSQVKLLPLIYFFSFLALLKRLALTPREIMRGFMAWAIVTCVVLLLLWVFVPRGWYSGHYVVGDASIFTEDNRGLRIRMPMYFALVGIFYCYRQFFATYKLKWIALTLGGFSLLLFAVKTRSMVLATMGVLLINAFRMAKPAVRLLLLALVPIALIGLFSVPYLATVFKGDHIRSITTDITIGFIGTSPWRWLFGLGSITPLDPGGMITYFNHFFFLADITWLGVVFEYGLIGAVLFAMVPLRGMWLSRKLQNVEEDVFLGCLQDYLLFAILVSPLAAIILAPGEMTIILAVFVYEWPLMRLGAL